MNFRTEHGVYLVLAFVGVVFFILLSFMGPVGWIFDVVFVLAVLKLAEWSGFFQGTQSEPKRNCPVCGARNFVDDAECSYCGEALADVR
ncbi:MULTISPECIES: zinc ribbon domain-containing protein [unclassified Haladaptatus]|uniref:zinc ribbon domain-containing protein n=1 Tax=unclassified Haladaptatus TaxID=2622732 RepID=UPI00209C3C43|nr:MULTISPECIES: zinc ribbon domain-containing protein [unclassified Haladaptatus]MCO8244467.1 zinc ribbon domain-containing protein [Haladaptatus sp. AB643]MCO8253911.1 zinc ribbon domain-containing protein [Haladaptatus sp. AB618]